MALNQTILTPLTLFSGSLSAHTAGSGSTQGQLMAIISSSIPAFQSAFWNYKIKTETTYNTSSTAVNISELTVNLTGSATTGYHIIIGYYGLGCSSVTNAPRLGNAQASTTDGSVVTELPDTLTSLIANWEGTTGPNSTTWPSANINNFYLGRHIFIGKPNTSTGTFIPTLAVNATGSGITASMGPSIIFWKKFT
jgi:hypothetical protein